MLIFPTEIEGSYKPSNKVIFTTEIDAEYGMTSII